MRKRQLAFCSLILAFCGAAHAQNVRVVVQPAAPVVSIGAIGAQLGASNLQGSGINLGASLQSPSPSLALPTPSNGLLSPAISQTQSQPAAAQMAPAAAQSAPGAAPAAAAVSQVSSLPSSPKSVSPSASVSPARVAAVSPSNASQAAPALEPAGFHRHHRPYVQTPSERGSSQGRSTAQQNARDAEKALKGRDQGRVDDGFNAIFDGSDLRGRQAAAVQAAVQAEVRGQPASPAAMQTEAQGRQAVSHIALQAAARPSYLAEADGKVGQQLLEALHNISGRGVRVSEYRDASHYMFSVADNVTVDGVRGVIDAYSGIFVAGTGASGDTYKERGDADGDGYASGMGMNVEHSWPQSYFGKGQPMRSDLHHLMPTFEHSNGERSNYPFGEVKPEDVIYHTRGGAKLGRSGVFEPPDAVKGRVARNMLYFYMRYYNRDIFQQGNADRFWNSRIEMFLRWNRQFPPTADEQRRNGLVEKYQGNRNPFVDDPSLAEKIGIDAFRSGKGRKYAAPVEEGQARGEDRSGRNGYRQDDGYHGRDRNRGRDQDRGRDRRHVRR